MSLQYQKNKHIQLLCVTSKEWLNYNIVGQRLTFPFSTEKQCSLCQIFIEYKASASIKYEQKIITSIVAKIQ